jgi:hypothetical protein
MGKGGNAPRRKGDAFEVAVVKDQERFGRWARRLRQGGGEVVDIVAIHSYEHAYSLVPSVFLIQCKVDGYMSPVERERLVMDARAIGATPLLAFKDNSNIGYKEIRDA